MASEHTSHIQCRAVRFVYLGPMCAISKSPTTAKLLNVTKSRLKSTVNSSQCRQPSDTMVISSHDFMVWRVNRVTSWLAPF